MIDDGARERNLPGAGLDCSQCQKLPLLLNSYVRGIGTR